MEHENTQKDKKQAKVTKPALLLWIIPLILLIILTVIIVIGVHIIESRDGDVMSQLKGLVVLLLIIVFFLLLIGFLLLYSSARYIQLPMWRRIARGFKGKPDVPWLTKSKENKIKQ